MASLSPEVGGTYTLGADGMYYPKPFVTYYNRPQKRTNSYI